MLVGALDLPRERLNPVGEQGVQGEDVAFGGGEGGAFVEGAVVEESFPLEELSVHLGLTVWWCERSYGEGAWPRS